MMGGCIHRARGTALGSRFDVFMAVVLLGLGWSGAASAAITIGVLGDSLSDEYAYNGRAYAKNWVEQLVTYAGVDFGPLGNYSSPRNHSYAYNWALSGATTSSMISTGQVSGLAAQIPVNGIDHVVIDIGSNDFIPNGSAFNNIYNGTWSQTQINNYVNQAISNIETAITTEQNAGADIVVSTIGNYGLVPAVAAVFRNAAGIQRLANAITQVNAGILQSAQNHQIVAVNYDLLYTSIFANGINSSSNFLIGNVPIYVTQNTSSSPSQAAFVADGIHPNSAIQGIVANLFMTALNNGYHAGAPIFTEAELLAHQGLAYGGSDTLVTQIGPYSNYVVNYVPEVSSFAMAGAGFVAFLLLLSRRRFRIHPLNG